MIFQPPYRIRPRRSVARAFTKSSVGSSMEPLLGNDRSAGVPGEGGRGALRFVASDFPARATAIAKIV